MSKHEKNEKKEIPVYEINYWCDNPEKGCELVVYDKKGRKHSKVKLNEKSAASLRDSLNDYLGESGA